MRTIEDLIAELAKCTVELEESIKEEVPLIPKFIDFTTKVDLPPAIVTKQVLDNIQEIHKRQLAILNKRSGILQELRELHEQLDELQVVKERQESEKRRKAQSQSVEKVLAHVSQQARELFLSLHEMILKMGGVEALPWQWWIDYRKKGTTFLTLVTPDFERNGLGIFIRMGTRQINDPKRWTTKVAGSSELNTTFRLHSTEQLDYAMSLVRQAYDYVQ